MARSDRSRRGVFVVAFFVSALGVGAAGACSAVPDVVYVTPDASTTVDARPDSPPGDTGVKDTGMDTASTCGAAQCCGNVPCPGCNSAADCSDCLALNCAAGGEMCCKKGGSSVKCLNNCN